MRTLFAKTYTTAADLDTEQAWLLSSDTLTDPLIAINGGYALNETDDTSNNLRVRRDGSVRLSVTTEESTVSVSTMVKTIRAVFGLNAHQVAQLVGVSRATLYNHLQGGGPVEHYQALYRAAQATHNRVPEGVGRALKAILIDGHTLHWHLKRGYNDPDRVAQLAQRAVQAYGDQGQSEPVSAAHQRDRVRAISTQG